MARHIMAVCVVCLLCADRVPCEQHLSMASHDLVLSSPPAATIVKVATSSSSNVEQQQSFRFHTPVPLPGGSGGREETNRNWIANVFKRSATATVTLTTTPTTISPPAGDQFVDDDLAIAISPKKIRSRTKRHGHGHSHANHNIDDEHKSCWQPEITRFYLKRLFQQPQEYKRQEEGSDVVGITPSTTIFTSTINDERSMSMERGQFQSLLQQMGLLRLLEQPAATTNNDKNICISDAALVLKLQRHSYHHHDDGHDHDSHIEEDSIGSMRRNETTVKCPFGLNAAGPCPTTNWPQSAPGIDDKRLQSKSSPSKSNSTVFDQLDMPDDQYSLTQLDMLNVCPVLLYQLLSNTRTKNDIGAQNEVVGGGCIESATIAEIERLEMTRTNLPSGTKEYSDIFFVWIYSFVSVLACSLLGLVGVIIIPFMDSHYYKHILQFLVSLAVGTMTGDAVLHLLPHSLAGQSEKQMVLKGLTCMGGIVFFYAMEHSLTMISEWRKRLTRLAPPGGVPVSIVRVLRDTSCDSLGGSGGQTGPPCSLTEGCAVGSAGAGGDGGNSRALSASSAAGGSTRDGCGGGPDSLGTISTGDKLCKSKYSSYPYCYDEITHDTTANEYYWPHQPYTVNEAATNLAMSANVAIRRNGRTDAVATGNGDYAAQAQSLLAATMDYEPLTELPRGDSSTPSEVGGGMTTMLNGLNEKNHGIIGNSTVASASASPPTATNNSINNSGGGGGCSGSTKIIETRTVIVREHASTHHGHSHMHGHVHSPPESLSSVAWMIIMGDGLHNFTDGMAIGAAFADNIAGGFSTSLAVFCHELPHELGDFAILIKAGMTVKSAVYYNLLTGILSFIGMFCGILFGQSQDMAQWMFAAASGLFIYIALVDMMPELTSAHKSLSQFALQLLGMITGVLVMLCIAIYEDDLLNLF